MRASRKQTITRTRGAVALVSLGLVVVLAAFAGASSRGAGRQLAPTAHPTLSATVGDMWLVPAETAATTRSAALYQPLTDAVAEIGAGNYERALALLNRPSLGSSALADYASYYKGIAQLRLSRAADARATFEGLRGRELSGYLAVATPLGEAEAVVALGDHARALAIYEKLTADKTAVNEQILVQAGRGGEGPRRSPQGGGSPAEDLLRVPAHRRGSRGRCRARAVPRHHRPAGLQARSRPSPAVVWRAAVLRCARGVCRAAGRGERRRPRTGRSPRCRIRFLPAASSGRARRAEAVARPRVAPGRGPLLPPECAARTGARRRVPLADRCAHPRLPGEHVVRGSAQQSGHLLHSQERRRDGGEDLRSALCEVPQRAARRPRGLEVRMVGLQERRLCRHGARLRGRCRIVPAVGLPAALPVLVSPFTWKARLRSRRRVAAAARGDRLRQLVLRPPGRAAPLPKRADRARAPMPFRPLDSRLPRGLPIRRTRA